MLATYQKPTDAPTGPTKSAVAAYRKHVQSNEDVDQGVCDAAWRIASDATTDRHIWEKRQDAAYRLTVAVPQLQTELAEARAAMQNERMTGTRLVSEFGTVGELLAALLACQQEGQPNHRPASYARAYELESAIVAERAAAVNTLRRTSDPAIARKLADLSREAADMEVSIASLEDIANIDEKVAKQQQLCAIMAGDTGDKAKKAYLMERRRLTELQGLVSQKPQAVAALDEARQRLAGVHRQVQELEQARLDPINQEWAE